MPSLEVFQVVFVQRNLVANKSEAFTFIPNTSYSYLLNGELSNLVLLKTYNTEFDEIVITFPDQNGIPLKIENIVNLTLFINK